MSDTMTGFTAVDGNTEKTPALFRPIRHVVRLTVEAMTPLSPSSGDADADMAAPLFRDWNGLPCLSGAAIAGVIRSLYGDYFSETERRDLFGYEENRDQSGAASRLIVSFGLAHGADDKPVDGYAAREVLIGDDADTVLAVLHHDAPVDRDHVALNEDGVAEKNKLFDRVSCPKGTRFTLELALDGEAEEIAADKELLLRAVRMIEAPHARFGAAGRRGLGRLKIVRDGDRPRAFYAAIDRRGKEGRAAWESCRLADLASDLPQDLFDRLPAGDIPPTGASLRGAVAGELRLVAKGFWRFGQGLEPWLPQGDGEGAKVPDVSPPTEPAIEWTEEAPSQGTVVSLCRTPVPGSGIKGAIRHRTLFHLRRIFGAWAEDTDDSDAERNPKQEAFDKAEAALNCLFGAERREESGAAGALFLDDIYVDFADVGAKQRVGQRTRNSIDRHTGGVRLGKLFTDEALWRQPAAEPKLVVPFVLLSRVPDPARFGERKVEPSLRTGSSPSPFMETPANAVKALVWALEDLCGGRLALGAREGTGDGVFTGHLTGPGGAAGLDLIDKVNEAVQRAEGEEKRIRATQWRKEEKQGGAPGGKGREAA